MDQQSSSLRSILNNTHGTRLSNLHDGQTTAIHKLIGGKRDLLVVHLFSILVTEYDVSNNNNKNTMDMTVTVVH